ncbi:phosphatidylethanolamine-binding protein 4 isoform X2 [Varanus komodoensis]|uniref:Phosphatidylethanolamine binding protein 4 n=2 Tax=Varanus komodoensis TaxID=61221 RepID=A0A8D2LAC3_VARKO|nr:phosphatidylethanolamine-binding protein 4 isoform X2 [Varanus komodoensis]XP_044293503.1 phosphatidylethanolamine-binding protein 4 isoform X2 [Varanus komodoensis]
MKPLVPYFLVVIWIVIGMQEGVHMDECIFEKLDGEESMFCRGHLQILYPELGDVACTYIPKCNLYRKQISKEWSSPKVRYQQADENKKYVLIMVDPDAPSRANPKYRFWRHWTVINIPGADLKKGKLQGFVLSDYRRPTPPSRTGYHRYQFLLYEQPASQDISLSPEESSSAGSWKVENFVNKFQLGTPVASAQFMTKHYSD